MSKKLNKFMWGYPILAIILAAVGICLIALNNSLTALAITIGTILTVAGIILAIVAIANKNRGVSFAFKVIFAAVCIVCGVFTLIFNKNAVEIIISIFSLLIIIDSSFKLQTSAMSKRYGVVLWWVILALSVLTITGSFILLKFPFKSQEIASVWLGVIFIIEAVSNLLSALYVSAYEARRYHEAYIDAKIKLTEELRAHEHSQSVKTPEKEISGEEKTTDTQMTYLSKTVQGFIY